MTQQYRVLPTTPWSARSLWLVEWRPFLILLMSLAVVGVGEGLILCANLGSAPWTVLSQGIALQGDFNIGWASMLISLFVMLSWLPLRLKLGIATLLNIFIIALFLGLTTTILESPDNLWIRFMYLLVGTLLFGIGSAFYLTCHQGAGPRDGLMVGLCKHFHINIGIVRTVLEVIVCIIGWLLGGTIGIGTILFALLIGWIVQISLEVLNHYTLSFSLR